MKAWQHWHSHPAVRSGADLTPGERAADVLKHYFGSWLFLGLLNGFIVAWITVNTWILGHPFDPYPYILLNLGLSWLAAQQGGALQISANRGDRISSELAKHTYENGQELLAVNRRQLEILEAIKDIHADLEALSARLPAPRARK
jgi:uncharacterized membrane protein